MMNLISIISQLNNWESKNRDQLSVEDLKILEDFKQLIEVIDKEEDSELRKIHLLDLAIKLNAFFLGGNGITK